jgi:hypothetical protein
MLAVSADPNAQFDDWACLILRAGWNTMPAAAGFGAHENPTRQIQRE